MIDVKHLKNGDKFLVSRELEDGTIIRDIPCTLINGLFQDDKTNQVYGSSVFAVTIDSDIKRRTEEEKVCDEDCANCLVRYECPDSPYEHSIENTEKRIEP